MVHRGPGRASRVGLPTIAVAALALTACSAAVPAATAGHAIGADFASAAGEFGVPENVLLAVSYNMTAWHFDNSAPNAMGGYGPMGLQQGGATSGKGSQAAAAGPVDADSQLAAAAKAAGVPTNAVRTDPAQNIRAAAALLAADGKTGAGRPPGTVAGWRTAVARYSQAPSTAGQNAFADDVFRTLRAGATARIGDGETLTLAADHSLPQQAHTTSASDSDDPQTPDCPATLDCRFVPAAYGWSSDEHSDPNNYGNFDPANRPADGDAVQYIVIHDTEGSYDSAIANFENPAVEDSANYVIRSSDGQVTQMVPTSDLTWATGNWTMNMHSINIEVEGFAAEGSQWYTQAAYQATAQLVRHLAAQYHIPLDREHVIAHEDVPGELTSSQARQHYDPGVYWDWQKFMTMLGAPIHPTGSPASGIVTISPNFATNQPPVTSCDATGTCTPEPAQGANFVYLRTGPGADYPLINDPLIHSDGSAGTTRDSDWTDKAVTGHDYAVAGQSGEWTAIWYDGQKAWFDNPDGVNTLPARGELASVPSGAASVALYGRAFPDLSAYPADIPFAASWAPTPLTTWTFPQGQSYVVVGQVRDGNYYARYDPADVADNHTLVTDGTTYLVIDYNHRYLFVRAQDVTLSRHF